MKTTVSRGRGSRANRVTAGAVGGLIGGIFFGLLLAALGMLPVIAELIGSNSILVGLLVHSTISAIFGALFGFFAAETLENHRGVMLYGAGYGVFWWVVGGLVLMPVLLGRGPQLHMALLPQNLMSLLGHLVYGLALAVTVFVLIHDEHG